MQDQEQKEGKPPSHEELYDYFQARLSEEREQEIEVWMARSDRNAEMARQVRDLETVVEDWTAEAHAQALWHARMARLRERLGTAIEGAVGIVMQAGEQGSHIIREMLGSMLLPSPRWQFALPSSRALGAEEEVIRHVSAVGEIPAHVTVSGEEHVAVRIDRVPRGTEPPLVRLMRLEGDDWEEAAAKQPEAPRGMPDAPYLVAHFETGPGTYMVVLTPPAA